MPKPAETISNENRAAADALASAAPRGVGVEMAGEDHEPFILFRGPWWLVLVVAGLTTIAACILLPLREENRRLGHQLAETRQEAEYVAAQSEANDAFLKQIHEDPTLIERVAMRMTNRPAAGLKFLDGEGEAKFGSSPFQLTEIAPPSAIDPYRSDLPLATRVLFIDPRARLIMLASGVFLLASALVLGGNSKRIA